MRRVGGGGGNRVCEGMCEGEIAGPSEGHVTC